MKKLMAIGSSLVVLALLLTSFGLQAEAATPTVNVTGNYIISMEYQSNNYAHNLSLTQDNSGNLTGNGSSGAYTWVLTSGSVSGNAIDFLANYTATADAVTPQTVLHVVGTVAADGTISGTWSDNYQGGDRTGSFSTISGGAQLLGTLNAEDFGVVNYDTGLGILKGYTAGFGVADNTFTGATSVVVKLYGAGDQLLQTNTAIFPKFNDDITGSQFSSPFDVSGSFAYAADGYWTNVRESQYGQSVPATKVVATVTLANGKVVTATNTNLTGDPTTIYPAATHTITASAGANGAIAPSGSVVVTDGTNKTFTITANSGYHVAGVMVDSIAVGAVGTYTFTNVIADHTISASFAADSAQTYTITASAGANGMITPSGAVSVNSGSNQTFTITPSSGYSIQDVLVDNASVGVLGAYTFSNVTANHTISASFVTSPVTTGPQNKDACKDGGWKTFTSLGFKNQGLCIAYTNNHQ